MGATGQALGPSGVWDAHGEPWLWHTEEMVMGFSSLSHHPPILSALPPWHEQPVCAEEHRSNIQDCAFPSSSSSCCCSSSLWPPRTSAVKGTKVFDSSAPDDDSPARLLQLRSFSFCAPAVRVFWRGSPSCHLRGWVRCLHSSSRIERSSFPGFTPTEPGPSWQPGGGGRSLFFWSSLSAPWAGPWRRRKRITRVPLRSQVRIRALKHTRMFSIIHWARAVSAGLCGWTDSGINRWSSSCLTGIFYCNANKPSILSSYINGIFFIYTAFPTVHSCTLLCGKCTLL